VAVTFAAVAVVSSTLLGLLAWQLVQQDRQLDEPRRRGLAEAAADSAAAHLAAVMGRMDAPRDGATVITIEPDRTSIGPAGSLPFVPTRPQLPEADAAVLQGAAALEFAGRPDLPRVIAAYRALSASGPPQDRAAALARLAPLLARSGDETGALRTYQQLGQFDDVAVGGLPASSSPAWGAGRSWRSRISQPISSRRRQRSRATSRAGDGR
jgi:hypothetical protein